MSYEKKPMTGIDVQLSTMETRSLIDAIATQMRLRQWCVDQTVKVYEKASEFTVEEIQTTTEFFYKFLTTTKENYNA